MTLFEALTGGAFDRLNWQPGQHSGEFDQNFSKKSNARGFSRERGWAVLKLTGTLLEFFVSKEIPQKWLEMRCGLYTNA